MSWTEWENPGQRLDEVLEGWVQYDWSKTTVQRRAEMRLAVKHVEADMREEKLVTRERLQTLHQIRESVAEEVNA